MKKTAAEWEAEREAASAAYALKPTFENYMRCDHAVKMAAGARLRERKVA